MPGKVFSLLLNVMTIISLWQIVDGCGMSIQIYGPSIGPCIDNECPDGYMCINDVCVKGCYDTCSDCYCYLGLCNNPMYARQMQCCNRSCGKCTP